MEAAVYERQTHSVSGRTRRHGQRQRQVHRQWTAELLDGEGDHPRSVPSTRRYEHHRVPVLRLQPACRAWREGADARRPESRLLHGARLLDDGIVFRNPDAYHLPVWQGDGRESRECGANPRGMEERRHGIMGYRQFRCPAG